MLGSFTAHLPYGHEKSGVTPRPLTQTANFVFCFSPTPIVPLDRIDVSALNSCRIDVQ